jgi:ligand-binding sensor domain-containing protein
MKLTTLLFIGILSIWTACSGQISPPKEKADPVKELFVKGDPVKEPGSNIMVIYQDKTNTYWFGSWETGVYKYDGNELVNYTTKHGLLNNRIDEIKEDKFGNIYFASANAKSSISRFNGKTFTTLTAVPSENWKLESTDLWFKYSYGNTGRVYRYDGFTLVSVSTIPSSQISGLALYSPCY